MLKMRRLPMLKKNIILVALALVLSSLGCSFKQQPQLETLSKRAFRTTIETENANCDALTDDDCIGDNFKVTKTSDYAVKVIVGVRNRGGEGKIRTEVILNTPEGQFYEKKIISVKSNEEKTLEFVFLDVSALGEIGEIAIGGKNPTIAYEFRSEPLPDDTPLTTDKTETVRLPEM